MKKIITQKDEQCQDCWMELPKGSSAYSDGFDLVVCPDCYNYNQKGGKETPEDVFGIPFERKYDE